MFNIGQKVIVVASATTCGNIGPRVGSIGYVMEEGPYQYAEKRCICGKVKILFRRFGYECNEKRCEVHSVLNVLPYYSSTEEMKVLFEYYLKAFSNCSFGSKTWAEISKELETRWFCLIAPYPILKATKYPPNMDIELNYNIILTIKLIKALCKDTKDFDNVINIIKSDLKSVYQKVMEKRGNINYIKTLDESTKRSLLNELKKIHNTLSMSMTHTNMDTELRLNTNKKNTRNIKPDYLIDTAMLIEMGRMFDNIMVKPIKKVPQPSKNKKSNNIVSALKKMIMETATLTAKRSEDSCSKKTISK